MIDKNNPKFGGLLTNAGRINLENTNAVLESYDKAVEKMSNKCEEWTKLLSTFLPKEEVTAIINILDPKKSQPIDFGYKAEARLDIEKIDKFFNEAARRKGFISRDGSETKEFRDTTFARNLGYCLNHMNVVGTIGRTVRNIRKSLPPGSEMKNRYINIMIDACPRVQEKLLSKEDPENCRFDIWRSTFNTAVFVSEYLKGKPFEKDDWKDMLLTIEQCKDQGITDPKQIPDVIDAFFYRAKNAFFGDKTPDLTNSSRVMPTMHDERHKQMQLDAIVDQYVAELSSYMDISFTDAEKIVKGKSLQKKL